MSFPPSAVTPEYSEIDGRRDHSHLREIKFPADKNKISRLTLSDKQVWYAAQDPHELIESGEEFQSFWYWRYIVPLKIKRLVFLLKFW